MTDEAMLLVLRNLHERLLRVEVRTENLSEPPPGVVSKTARETFEHLLNRLSPEERAA
jgi:hypothetical protein